MKFNNVENKCHKLADGTEIWQSRSVATASIVLLKHLDEYYVLINKRGAGMPDYVGYWNLPCGYLDFNETTCEAAIREIYEECDLSIPELVKNSKVILNKIIGEPWRTNSDPNDSVRQNITFHYGIIAEVDEIPIVSNKNCILKNGKKETDDVKFVNVDELYRYKLAFNHEKRILEFIAKFKTYLQQ